MILGKSKDWINTTSNTWGYGICPEKDSPLKEYISPFIDYILEDKTQYPFATTVLNDKTGINYIDPDADFRIGKSGGLLMNIDFIFVNTDIFTTTAKYFRKHGRYCPHEEGTPKYESFWAKEYARRRKGIQARCKVYHTDVEEYYNPKTSDIRKEQLRHYVRITGDHYNYINYGRIERTPSAEERIDLDRRGLIATSTLPEFPNFWDADYWYFKMDEFIVRNKKNLCLAKARRKGVSYKRASQSANRVNLNKSVTVVLAADIIEYLTGLEATASMAKKNLDWYETETYWKRGFLSEATDSIELGYKIKKEGNKKYGFRSKIISVAIGRNESAAVGKKAIDIDFEEAGKCFGKGTLVIMADGTFKEIEEIVVGDEVMGVDSKPRIVTHTQTGIDNLYEVTPLNGDPHVVNSKHDIYMIFRNKFKGICEPKLMTAPDYISMINNHPRWKDNHALIKTGISFEHRDVIIEPYVFGLWLGDGAKDDSSITNMDPEVIDYIKEYTSKNNLRLHIGFKKGTPAVELDLRRTEGSSYNWFRQELARLEVLGNKDIPVQYMFNDEQSRLELLAGMIDTDGNYDSRKHNFEIVQKNANVCNKLMYICRSLGLKTTTSEKVINGETYYRVLIMSDTHRIPTKIARKQADTYDSLHLNTLETRFEVKPYGRDEYYGITVSDDSLFMLSDFTIVHNCPNLQNAWNVTLSNIESGAIKIGTGRIYGTAGTKNANWTAFSNVFYNTGANNMIAFENVWNFNSRHTTCGFFIPQIWCCEPYIYDGNSLLLDAWLWDKKDKKIQRDSGKSEELVIYVAQRANMPSEAFIDTKDNLFTSPVLNDHIQDLYDDPNLKYYTDGWYIEDGKDVRFIGKDECISRNIFGNSKFHPYIDDVPHNSNTDIHGCVREIYNPYMIDGKVPKDIYFITADTYRIDKNMDQVTIKNSLYSIQCWLRSNKYTPYTGKKLVAEYCGRLDTMAENDKVALNMSIRYNCGVLPEAGTGEIISNFKTWGYRDKLMLDPTALIDRSIRDKSTIGYGVVIGDGEKKFEGLRMFKDFLYEVVSKTENNTPVYRLNTTNSLALCLELQRYSLTGNFDRISSAIVAMFEFKKDFILLKDAIQYTTVRPERTLKDRLKRKSIVR